jgi:hypothetical protein
MKRNWVLQMLATFDYHSVSSLFESIAPSFRYSITKPLLIASATYPSLASVLVSYFPAVDAVLGISGGAFIAMMAAFFVELLSGLVASHTRKEQFSSLKLSRFTLKVCIYLVIIAVPYHWAQSFKAHDRDFMAGAFSWLQSFLIAQIAFENIVSILENLAVVSGDDKTAWINKIKDKLAAILS